MSDKKDMMFTLLDDTPEEQKNLPKNFSVCLQKKKKNNLCQMNLLILMKINNVSISGYTTEQCQFIQKQHKELLRCSYDNYVKSHTDKEIDNAISHFLSGGKGGLQWIKS